jgi:hypothetical protein
MRLISAASLPPPQNYLAVQGSRMLLGRAPCDSIQEDQASGPFSRARSSLANLVAFPPSPARYPFPKDKNRPLWTYRSSERALGREHLTTEGGVINWGVCN